MILRVLPICHGGFFDVFGRYFCAFQPRSEQTVVVCNIADVISHKHGLRHCEVPIMKPCQTSGVWQGFISIGSLRHANKLRLQHRTQSLPCPAQPAFGVVNRPPRGFADFLEAFFMEVK